MTENVMCDEFIHVRNMLANLAMDELWSATRELVDKYDYYGAEIYLKAQLRAVNDLQDELAKEADDLFGD